MASGECRSWLLGAVVSWVDAQSPRSLKPLASLELAGFIETPEGRRAEWVPTAWLVEALLRADELVGRGDLSLCWGIGIHMAKREAGAVQQLAMRILRPSIIMSLAPSLWNTHFRDVARVAVRGRGDCDVLVSFSGATDTPRALCLAIGGWMEGWLLLGPRKNVRVQHTSCRAEGQALCEYAVTWEE